MSNQYGGGLEYIIVGLWALAIFGPVIVFIFRAKLGRAVNKLALKPFFGGINTALGISVGYLGSHFDKEIYYTIGRFYIPPAWTDGKMWVSGQLTYVPIFFWTLATLAILGFVAALSAQATASAEVNEEFRAAFKKLFTMPNRGFLNAYKDSALISAKLAMDLPQTGIPLLTVQSAIRAHLEAICRIVKQYDNEKQENTYGCNIMLYFGSSTPKFLSQLPMLQASIKCIENAVALQNLAGVLQLQLPLSVCSETGRHPDARLTDLALPLPEILGPFDELDFIPGAPLAFASRNSRVYRNQTDLIEKVDKNRRFSSKVLNDLVTTLDGQSGDVQGLICIPIFDYFAGNPAVPIGILNIHKSRSDEHIEEKFSNLGPLLAPIIQNLEKLLSLYP